MTHDIQPGQEVSFEQLSYLRKTEHERRAREGITDEVEADQDDASAPAEAVAEVRKGKQPAVHRAS
jgi:hypothetical protein